MSTSDNSNGPNASTAMQQQQSAPMSVNVVFILPPPPTVWVQFNDGMQMGLTQSVFNGLPPFRSGGDGNGNNSNGFLNALNEIFQRAQEQQHGPPPTSKSFLDKLPLKMWTQEMQKSERQMECVICLSDFEKDDKVISLPCGHTFHKDCGMTWLIEHNVCPTCRYQLPTQKEVSTTPTSTQTTLGGIADPEQEPCLPEATLNVTGLRRQRPTETLHPRDVRQRVDGPTVASLSEDAEMELMLEQEADCFVKEEMEQRQSLVNVDGVEICDCDVEELLRGESSK